MNKKFTMINSDKFKMIIPLLFFIITCSSTQNSRFKTKIENEWLLLQNVGYQIENGNVLWTAGGNFKVSSIKEVRVSQILSDELKKELFVYKGNIPKGFFLAKSQKLNKEESKFLKEDNDTKMFIEVILVDVQNNEDALYTPVSYSAASKKSIRTVLDSINPNWDK